MCRFSVSNAPPPAPESPGLEQLLEDDGFDWFDSIADLPDDAALPAMELPSAHRGDSASASAPAPSPAGASSDSTVASASEQSSYDLMEMFRQQAQGEPAAPPAPAVLQARYEGLSASGPALASPPACMPGLPGAPPPQLCLPPYGALPGVLPAAAMLSPAAAAGYTLAGLPLPATAMAAPPAPASAPQQHAQPPAPRKSRSQRTQAEIEAAVERIKQKRRESASRSRARKNEYMRQLEMENAGLKDEVARLSQLVAALQQAGGAAAYAAVQQQQLIAMV